MNLTEIRTWAIKMSGRTDLGAVDGTTDTGIDDFLQQGGLFVEIGDEAERLGPLERGAIGGEHERAVAHVDASPIA